MPRLPDEEPPSILNFNAEELIKTCPPIGMTTLNVGDAMLTVEPLGLVM
jgi:hypothetical protein